MLSFAKRTLQCVSLAAFAAYFLAAQPPAQSPHDEAANLRAAVSKVSLGDWRYNGFEAVDVTNPQQTPWFPFLTATKGYVAMFINPSKDIPNNGKGGGAKGSRH